MPPLIEIILVAVIANIIAAIILFLIKKIFQKPWGLKVFIGTALLTVGLSVFIYLLLPPYNVSVVRWCLNEEGNLLINGSLTTRILNKPVPNFVVQIKVYQSGHGDPPFKAAQYPTTEIDGTFITTYHPPSPDPTVLYVINSAYKYETLLSPETWRIKDFNASNPRLCIISP